MKHIARGDKRYIYWSRAEMRGVFHVKHSPRFAQNLALISQTDSHILTRNTQK